MQLRPELEMVGRRPRAIDLGVAGGALILSGRLLRMARGTGFHPLEHSRQEARVLLDSLVTLDARDLRLGMLRVGEADLGGLPRERAPSGRSVLAEKPCNLLLDPFLWVLVQVLVA